MLVMVRRVAGSVLKLVVADTSPFVHILGDGGLQHWASVFHSSDDSLRNWASVFHSGDGSLRHWASVFHEC